MPLFQIHMWPMKPEQRFLFLHLTADHRTDSNLEPPVQQRLHCQQPERRGQRLQGQPKHPESSIETWVARGRMGLKKSLCPQGH